MKEVAPGYYEFSEDIRRLLANNKYELLQETAMANPLETFGEETVFLLFPPDDLSADPNFPINDEYLCRIANGNIDLVLYVVPKELIDPLL